MIEIVWRIPPEISFDITLQERIDTEIIAQLFTVTPNREFTIKNITMAGDKILARVRDDSKMIERWLIENSSKYEADSDRIVFSFPNEDAAILFKMTFA